MRKSVQNPRVLHIIVCTVNDFPSYYPPSISYYIIYLFPLKVGCPIFPWFSPAINLHWHVWLAEGMMVEILPSGQEDHERTDRLKLNQWMTQKGRDRDQNDKQQIRPNNPAHNSKLLKILCTFKLGKMDYKFQLYPSTIRGMDTHESHLFLGPPVPYSWGENKTVVHLELAPCITSWRMQCDPQNWGKWWANALIASSFTIL